MDIKIRFTKKAALIIGWVVLCGLISLGCWYNSTAKARQTIKDSCDNNCGCFANIVDYRLTNEQVRLFARFMKELQVRKTTSILEFMNTEDAMAIQRAFAVCRPQLIEPTPAPKQVEQPIIAQPVNNKNKKK